MIPCSKCAHDNPLGTMFCHGCGARLEVRTDHIMKSVAATKQATRERRLWEAGRSATSLALFLVICAIVLDQMLAPPLPPAEIPEVADVAVFETPPPAWVGQATPNAAGGAVAPRRAAGDLDRLDLRRLRAGGVAKTLGIDPAAIAALRAPLIAKQKDDGSFPGGEAVGATGLAALALQTWCDDSVGIAAAARARAWLVKQGREVAKAGDVSRSLALAALLDAGELDPAIRAGLGNRVVDGKAPVWQVLALPLYGPDQRPSEFAGLRTARDDRHWPAFLALLASQPLPADVDAVCGADAAAAATIGEARLSWALTAWHLGRAPEVFAATLKAWSTAPPAAVDPALAKAAGPDAAAAVALITLGAPLILPPLTLQQ
ncbi:MAG TPA: zinc ribbon domain-containing protein [Planctomycetota bacterium]|nr:zinc ribbon domain-containing protein [Planctomycetota bacterium]